MNMGATAETSRKKLAERDRLVDEMEAQLGLPSAHPEDEEILRTSAEKVVLGIKEGKWTCEAVVSAFIRSACAAQRKTNCLTEIVFREALADARAKDKAVAAGIKPEGEFFGLPSSFKDTYNIVGVDSSLGCSPYCFDPTEKPEEEGTLVQIFRQQGGIPICKTAIPQTLLAFECANPVFGVTSNPYSSARTPGGSSGGEAALITLRGTPLGWGSDIGGSLRIPAAYSGCCGLKPAVGRWPTGGNRATVRGFDGIKAVVGPMALTVDELTFASRVAIQSTVAALADKRFAGDNVVPLPWREANLSKKLKIGYWTDDGFVKASPANVRAVKETVETLRKLDHEVVEFTPPDVAQVVAIFAALTSADGYKQLLANLGPDPMEPSMKLVTLGTSMPQWLLWIASTAVKYGVKDPIFGDILWLSRTKSAGEYMNWSGERDAYNKAFRQRAWDTEEFDFIICPPQAVPALEHGRTKDLSPLCVGTMMFNVIDSTAGVLPVTRVDSARDAAPSDYVKGYRGSHLLNGRVYNGPDPAYDATKMHGLPVGVQIVGRSFDEEKVLAMMKIVEDAMGYK